MSWNQEKVGLDQDGCCIFNTIGIVYKKIFVEKNKASGVMGVTYLNFMMARHCVLVTGTEVCSIWCEMLPTAVTWITVWEQLASDAVVHGNPGFASTFEALFSFLPTGACVEGLVLK
jgi:hypothetical protein